MAEAFRQKFPHEAVIIRAVEKHARDEKMHYELFKEYFSAKNKMPFAVGPRYGYCDLMVIAIFGKNISALDPHELLENEEKFFQLCRAIMITEARGMRQVNFLLRCNFIQRDQKLQSIFSVVERDEPSHCLPYVHWLKAHHKHLPSRKEQWIDFRIHYSLLLWKIPLLVLNPFLRRRENFPA